MRSRSVLAALAAATLTLPIAACGSDSSSSSAAGSGGAKISTVHLGSFSRAVDYAPYLVAKQKGWFDEALRPLRAKAAFTEFDNAPAITESLATNKVDVVFEAEPPALIAKSAGIGVQVSGIDSSVRQEILVRAGSGITSVAGLKGKRIAVLSGTSSQYGLLKDLSAAGVSKSDVTVIDMPPADAKAAFESGKVDAWAIWPPFVQQEVLANKGTILPRGTHVIQSLMVTRSSFGSEQPRLLKAVGDTIQRAKTWIGTHPADAQKIVATQLDVPVEVVRRSWSVHDFSAQLDDAVRSDIQAKADFLLKQGFIKKPVDVGALVATG